MGQCLGKTERPMASVGAPRSHFPKSRGDVESTHSLPGVSGTDISHALPTLASKTDQQVIYEEGVQALVLSLVHLIGTFLEEDMEPPGAIIALQTLAETDHGWLQVVEAIISTVPLEHPLGPAVITLLIDECALPTKEMITEFLNSLENSDELHHPVKDVARHRNLCIVLGCLAAKLAASYSQSLCSDEVVTYLVKDLNISTVHPIVVLHALITLEKFAQTKENKLKIHDRLQACNVNPLLELEVFADDRDFLWRQIGFSAQWCLDNVFLAADRTFTYETMDLSGKNVLLNNYDVSEYLKISPNGLLARCDAPSFESVRCTYSVTKGAWYFEVTVHTNGVMQIGVATKNSKFLNHEGYGIGDDENSIAFDGCRGVIWHDAKSRPHKLPNWKAGDIVGVLLDIGKRHVTFSLNGCSLKPDGSVFKNEGTAYFAAASFMSYQQCEFNFGHKPFSFPPFSTRFKKFNDHAKLGCSEKMILPRHQKMELLTRLSLREDTCSLCFDKRGHVQLEPCRHGGFCSECALLLNSCPYCRSAIESRRNLVSELQPSTESSNEQADTLPELAASPPTFCWGLARRESAPVGNNSNTNRRRGRSAPKAQRRVRHSTALDAVV